MTISCTSVFLFFYFLLRLGWDNGGPLVADVLPAAVLGQTLQLLGCAAPILRTRRSIFPNFLDWSISSSTTGVRLAERIFF